MATPMMQTDRLTSSYLDTASPKKRKAISVANKGDVLFRKASFESDISLTAVLKTKKVIVPEIALMITSRHISSGISVRLTLSLRAIV